MEKLSRQLTGSCKFTLNLMATRQVRQVVIYTRIFSMFYTLNSLKNAYKLIIE